MLKWGFSKDGKMVEGPLGVLLQGSSTMRDENCRKGDQYLVFESPEAEARETGLRYPEIMNELTHHTD